MTERFLDPWTLALPVLFKPDNVFYRVRSQQLIVADGEIASNQAVAREAERLPSWVRDERETSGGRGVEIPLSSGRQMSCQGSRDPLAGRVFNPQELSTRIDFKEHILPFGSQA